MKTAIRSTLFFFLCVFITVSTSCTSNDPISPAVKGVVTDIDGNVYQTITIGGQTWMVDNMRTTRYNNGDIINANYVGDTTFVINSGDAVKCDTINVKYDGSIIVATSKRDKLIAATYKVDTIYISTLGQIIKVKRKSTIINVGAASIWSTLKVGAQCAYNLTANLDSIVKFGRLYNFFSSVDSRSIAPAGWHVPTNVEWAALQKYMNDNYDTRGAYAKALAATDSWMFSTNLGAIGADLSKNNASGFSGLPSGFRNANGTFNGMSVKSAWWSNSSSPTVGYAWYMGLFNYYNSAVWGANDDICGLSVRCVKDVK